MDKLIKTGGFNQYQVLLSSRSGQMLEQLEATISAETSNVQIQKRLVTNGHIDPLYDIDTLPDLLILHLSEHWVGELEELASHNSGDRPPVLVIGNIHNPDTMRLAMKAGARDFLTEPVNNQELINILQQLEAEKRQTSLTEKGALTAFINAKGGSGASFLSCNIAHMMQAQGQQEVILMDLDMQFGSLAQYLDMKPENGVSDALKVVEELDSTALNAYLMRHKSGLKVLGATTNTIRLPNQTPDHQLTALLNLLQKHCNQLVVDLPRMIDRTAINILQQANKIAVVVQQDFINLKDAVHLLGILRNELAVLDEQIVIIVNRYDKNSPIRIKDIQESLHAKNLVTVPNDYKVVLDSLNKGEPIHTVARRSAIAKALNDIQSGLISDDINAPKGMISNLFSRLRGG